jgi:pilus assembly protein CpaB
VTGYFLWAWKRSVDEQSEKNWDPVVVATVDINPRTKITSDMITMSSFPKTLIGENTVRKLKDVEGRITMRPINSKSQIRSTDLVQQGQTLGLAFDIPPGMRAIAIGAGEVMAVGTSVKPGDRVDILATYSDPRTRQELTKMLLQNVMVLAVNKGQTDQNGKEGANSSMTLAVKPEQTELVAAADRAGALRVSLRGVNDQVVVPTEGVSPRDFTGPNIPADAVVVTNEPHQTPVYIMPPAAQRPREIQIIRGDQQQTVSP